MKRFCRLAAFVVTVTVVISSLCITASAKGGSIAVGTAQIHASCLTVRSSASTKSEAVGRVMRGDTVVILEKTNSLWSKINYQGMVGYVASRYLRNESSSGKFVAVGNVNDDDVRMRSLPNTECDTFGYYSTGRQVLVLGLTDGWYKIRTGGRTGYMRSDYIDIVSDYVPARLDVNTPDKDEDEDEEGEKDPSSPGEDTGSSLGDQIAEYSRQFVGYDYEYGGASPETGFDCSGLVYYVYGQFGISLERGATSQYNENGYEVSYDDMQPGDLMFFANPDYGEGITHVGIYIGGGQMVHASDYGVGVVISDVTSEYRINTFYAAKRIVD